jgi:5-deoxy-D-glucuronate isomerase
MSGKNTDVSLHHHIWISSGVHPTSHPAGYDKYFHEPKAVIAGS